MTRRSVRRAIAAGLAAAGLLAPGCATAPAAPATLAIETPDGETLFAEVRGAGEPTLVVPAHVFLAEHLAPLAEGRRVVFYDMRNRGRSSFVENEGALSIQQDVADLETVRETLGLEQFDLLGFSYLGLMTAMYADAHPGRVRRLVQLGPVPVPFDAAYPAPYVEPPSVSNEEWAAFDVRRAALDPEADCLAEQELQRRTLVGNPADAGRLLAWSAAICALPNEHAASLQRHFGAHFVSVQNIGLAMADFADLDLPVLVIHGDRDRNAPYGAGREWAQVLPDARLVTVTGAGHAAFAEQPELVVGAIEAFLAEREPPGAERVTQSPRS